MVNFVFSRFILLRVERLEEEGFLWYRVNGVGELENSSNIQFLFVNL